MAEDFDSQAGKPPEAQTNQTGEAAMGTAAAQAYAGNDYQAQTQDKFEKSAVESANMSKGPNPVLGDLQITGGPAPNDPARAEFAPDAMGQPRIAEQEPGPVLQAEVHGSSTRHHLGPARDGDGAQTGAIQQPSGEFAPAAQDVMSANAVPNEQGDAAIGPQPVAGAGTPAGDSPEQRAINARRAAAFQAWNGGQMAPVGQSTDQPTHTGAAVPGVGQPISDTGAPAPQAQAAADAGLNVGHKGHEQEISQPLRHESLPPTAEANPESTKEQDAQKGRELAMEKLTQSLPSIREGLVDREKFDQGNEVRAKAEEALAQAKLDPSKIGDAYDQMTKVGQYVDLKGDPVKLREAFDKKNPDEQIAFIQGRLKGAEDKFGRLSKLMEGNPEQHVWGAYGFGQSTGETLKSFEKSGIVNPAKAQDLNAAVKEYAYEVGSDRNAPQNAPELFARSEAVYGNKELSQEESDRKILEVAGGNLSGLQNLKALENAKADPKHKPDLERIEQKLKDITSTEEVLSEGAMKNVVGNFGHATPENRDYDKVLDALAKRPEFGQNFENPAYRENFKKSLGEFFKQAGDKEFGLSVLAGKDGHVSLVRMTQGESASAWKLYVADVDQNGKAVGHQAAKGEPEVKKELHALYDTPAKDGVSTGEAPRVVDLKQGTSRKGSDFLKLDGYDMAGASPDSRYPYGESQWAARNADGTTDVAKTVENMRKFIESLPRPRKTI